ncbi:regulator of G-protein signaling 9-binding protein isoform X2 [Thalassophryne amazonica]|nr:regulator of G-protein signaling 9-binding protein isoform X2 [Thalassophryne amazonica]
MSRWQRSVTGLAARRRQQQECEQVLEALSRVTSCFQQLVASLGSSADCSFLREEMDEMSMLACRTCTCLSGCLVNLLSDCNSAPSTSEDRQSLERLWVLFVSLLETFLSDLQKSSSLIGQFPLMHINHRRSLVSTGCVDGVVGAATRGILVQAPWLLLDKEPHMTWVTDIAGLESMLSNMQLRVHVPFWSVEATQPAGAEVQRGLDEMDYSLEDLMELDAISHTNRRVTCCGLSCIE